MSMDEMDQDQPLNMTVSDDQPTTLLEQAETDSSYHSLECDPDGADQSREDESMLPTTIDGADNDEERHRYRDMSAISSNNSFWKYKPSPKGPYVQKYKFSAVEQINGHKPLTFIDPALVPIADGNTALLASKYRVGEGNDITPDPNKLAKLGREIKSVQHDIAAATNNTVAGRTKVQGTKRKLISRQCRLKRSANHEANKIIFHGLEKEREELSRAIRLLNRRVQSHKPEESLTDYCHKLQRSQTTIVAGEQEKYVNNVLERMTHRADENGGDGGIVANYSDTDSGDYDSAVESE